MKYFEKTAISLGKLEKVLKGQDRKAFLYKVLGKVDESKAVSNKTKDTLRRMAEGNHKLNDDAALAYFKRTNIMERLKQ